jgi:hypothetical protein
LRDRSTVKPFKIRVAVVAVSAIGNNGLRKITEQKSSPAGFQVTEFAHRIQLFEHDPALRGVAFDLNATL